MSREERLGLPVAIAAHVVLVAWLALFHFLGNSTLGYIETRSLFGWMHYSYSQQPDDEHGFIIPLVILVMFWWKRRELLERAGDVAGRMGREIARLVRAAEGLTLSGGTEFFRLLPIVPISWVTGRPSKVKPPRPSGTTSVASTCTPRSSTYAGARM